MPGFQPLLAPTMWSVAAAEERRRSTTAAVRWRIGAEVDMVGL